MRRLKVWNRQCNNEFCELFTGSFWTIHMLLPVARQWHWKTEERFGRYLHEHFARKLRTHIQTKQFYFPKT